MRACSRGFVVLTDRHQHCFVRHRRKPPFGQIPELGTGPACVGAVSASVPDVTPSRVDPPEARTVRVGGVIRGRPP